MKTFYKAVAKTFFVNRRVIRRPPEPVRFIMRPATRGYLRGGDKGYDPKHD